MNVNFSEEREGSTVHVRKRTFERKQEFDTSFKKISNSLHALNLPFLQYQSILTHTWERERDCVSGREREREIESEFTYLLVFEIVKNLIYLFEFFEISLHHF